MTRHACVCVCVCAIRVRTATYKYNPRTAGGGEGIVGRKRQIFEKWDCDNLTGRIQRELVDPPAGPREARGRGGAPHMPLPITDVV